MIRAVRRHAASAALCISVLALVASVTGAADAAKQRIANVVSKPRPHAVLKLDRKGRFPARAIPTVARARRATRADTLGGRTADDLAAKCNSESVEFDTWCLMAVPYAVPNQELGKNNYFYATQRCVELGGYLPTAAQLIGAAKEVKLAGSVGDDRLTASIDEDPSDGLKDRREMSATLVTTQAGSSAAGSQGVSDGSRGDPKTGEPDPVPQPASPAPESLQYVTVYDNGEKGGFAGSKPVSQPENFRCAFDKAQGQAAAEEG